jgi:hypothetical protein
MWDRLFEFDIVEVFDAGNRGQAWETQENVDSNRPNIKLQLKKRTPCAENEKLTIQKTMQIADERHISAEQNESLVDTACCRRGSECSTEG